MRPKSKIFILNHLRELGYNIAFYGFEVEETPCLKVSDISISPPTASDVIR